MDALQLTRFYNSQRKVHWTHTYSSYIRFHSWGVKLIMPDGQAMQFVYSADRKSATSPAAAQGQFKKVGDTWEYRDLQKDTRAYDAQGRLIQWRGHSGYAYSIRYDNLSTVIYGESTATVDPADIVDYDEDIAAGTLTITVGTGDTVELGAIGVASSATARLGQVVEAVNRKAGETGVSAYLVDNNDGTFDVEFLSSKLDAAGDPETVAFAGFTAATTGVADDGTGIVAATADLTGISSIDVTTEKGAYIAMKKIDDALDQVNGARATLGAVQSRFENAVANIQIGVENLSASRGRIMDADFAKETANLSRAQILQQAGTAMVAQANQAPQGVLSLLRS